jgi:hypothetical protein
MGDPEGLLGPMMDVHKENLIWLCVSVSKNGDAMTFFDTRDR